MNKYNCVIVYDSVAKKYLFCKRKKPPYKGLFNLVGGKVEDGEDALSAAYRELCEETGISREDIEFVHLMDMLYYKRKVHLEVYSGILKHPVILVEEKQSLFWIDEERDFFDRRYFAGDGNIGHMVYQMHVR